MILTGAEIEKRVKTGEINISPFNPAQVNPNSYNYRLGETLTFKTDTNDYVTLTIPEEGVVLEPHRTYLGHTYEVLGSDKYAMSLIGRSSTGRLGLFLQVSADLGHTGANHNWTLEILAAHPIRLYPKMIIGQISFWENEGQLDHYRDGYSQFNHPQISKMEINHDPNR